MAKFCPRAARTGTRAATVNILLNLKKSGKTS